MSRAFKDVCRQAECIALMSKSCDKVHACDHPCKGFAKETKCLPCLNEECVAKHNEENPLAKVLDGFTDEDYCSICYTAGLGQEPCV